MGVDSQCHIAATLLLGKSFVIHCRGGGVDPRTGLDEYGEEKITLQSLDHPARSKLLHGLR
jgi:hypothetical protein